MARHRRNSDPGVQVALPIVPMLDLSFQILFFFIITFNPGKVEGKMSMNLPATGTPQAPKPQDVDPSKISDTDLDVPSDFVVVVKYYEAKLSVAVRDSEKVYNIGDITEMDKLQPREQTAALKRLMDDLTKKLEEKRKEKDAEKKLKEGEKSNENVKIEGNSKLKYSILVNVMDACIRAGYAQVGFAPPPDLGNN